MLFYGGWKDCVMDYRTDEIPQPSEPPLERHLPFFKPGLDAVRQFSQGFDRRRQNLDAGIRLHPHAQEIAASAHFPFGSTITSTLEGCSFER
jgi:hypothetical protein